MCCQITGILLLLQAHSRLAAEAKLDKIRQDAENRKWNDDGAQEDISDMLTEPNMYKEDWELLVAAGFTLLFDVVTVVWVSVAHSLRAGTTPSKHIELRIDLLNEITFSDTIYYGR